MCIRGNIINIQESLLGKHCQWYQFHTAQSNNRQCRTRTRICMKGKKKIYFSYQFFFSSIYTGQKHDYIFRKFHVSTLFRLRIGLNVLQCRAFSPTLYGKGGESMNFRLRIGLNVLQCRAFSPTLYGKGGESMKCPNK